MFNYCTSLIVDIALAMFSLFILKIYFEIFFEKKDIRIVQFLCWGVYFVWQFMIGRTNILPAYVNIIISVC